MECLASIFGKVLDVITAPVTRQLGYLCNYGSNVQELESRLKELQDHRESVRVRVREAERNAENIHGHITAWLTKTDEKIAEIEEFRNEEGHQTIGCSNGSFPNLKLRHKLGRKAKKMIPQCVDLLQQSNFATFSYPQEPETLDVAICDNVYVPFKSRDAIVEEVMNSLKDPKIKMIGIYGQGGVGKTTLVKAVARRVKAEKLFNVVVIANITSTPDVRKIQGEIADILGLRLDDESEIGRAGRLKQRLKKEKEILIILDDLWAGLDLSMLGIQFQDDDINQITEVSMPPIGHNLLKDNKMASDSQRCKILLTSRDREILSSDMEVKDSIFNVNVMELEESEMLFNKIVGLTDEDSELKSLSAEIVHKCANLPLAIVAAGKALKNNKNKASWENALQRLQNQEMIEVLEPVEFSTMLSYDHLQTEELKSIFLLCAHLGKDPSIMYLVKYCIGLSIFQEVCTIKEVQDRTYESIKKLKNSSLLLDSNSSNDVVTMHDKICDAALSIACKQKNVFSRRYVKIDEWPDKDTFEKYTNISLHYCDMIDGIPEGMNCPNLKVFHLDSKDPSVKIPDKLFEGMKGLRVLILTGVDLSSFPSSVKYLIKLRMLCLEQCVLADNMSIIGELKNLRILSLLGSKFELLPSEIRQLGRLQLFDISSCTKLKVIPSNVISKLSSLEELHMGKTLIQWAVERKTNHNEIATLAELRYLQQLRSLDIYIQDITALPSSLFFNMLDSYKIVIGDFKMLLLEGFQVPSYKASRVLALNLKKGNVIHSQMGIKTLFKSIEQLFLGELDGLLNVTYELNVEGFPCLKHLTICKNSDIQNIIYSTKWEYQANAFPKLESICLYKLESLEKICNCQLTDTSFRCLKIMKIKICGRLKYLFSFHMVRLLTDLEKLEVSECDSLEDIVVVERQVNIGNDAEIIFPQLRYLTLQSLSELTCFYTNNKMISISQMETVVDCIPLFNTKVLIPNLESLELYSINIKKVWGDQMLPTAFQNLTKLNVNNCCSLKYLFSLSIAGNLVRLQNLFVRGCDMMKAIFDPEASQEVDVFPQLKKIKITNMEELEVIWHAQASINSFCSLESVTIEQCHKLVTIFPSYMAGRFHNLGILKVHYCESVEEIFDFHSTAKLVRDETNLRVVQLRSLPKLKHVWNKDPHGLMNFKILQDISVTRCPRLENIFPFSIGNGLKKLESLLIWNCTGMKEVVAKGDTSNRSNFTFEFPKLSKLVLSYLPELTCFCQGTHAIELQALTLLGIGLCGKLEAFATETSHSEVKPIRSTLLKVISNLKVLILFGQKEMEWFQDTIGDDIYQMHNIKVLSFLELTSTETLFWFLQRCPNLEILQLHRSIIKEEAFPCGSHASLNQIGTVVQLKNVSLYSSHIPLNVGFENGAILQRVEKLCIEHCYYSTNLIPSSIALTHLSYLEVTNCDRLRNLLTLSTAKSLVQLATMMVGQCAMMEEIITVEENGLEEKENEIVFPKLKSLELVSLRNLTSFCNCQSQLVFRFPSLENVKVSDCLKLEKFSETIMSTPNLEKVNVVKGEEEEDKWYWEGDLNATIQKIFIDKVPLEFCENLKLSCHPELQQLWQGEIFPPENCFNNVRSLEVENCSFLSEVFPSRLLPYFKNMEELQVRLSPVEIIFDLDGNGLRETNVKHFNLERMTLDDLINLKCIWSKDPGNTVSFIYLKEMVITDCAGIKTLFPASVARNLVRLKKLEIGRCHALEEIVGKDKTVADGASIKFESPYLTTLTMYDLPSLEFFYPGRYTLEFPSLESLHVSNNFDKLETFTSDFERHHQGVAGCEDEANNMTTCRTYLFIAEKVIPNLENLTLNGKDVMMLSQPNFPYDLLHKLKYLELCFGDSYEAGATLPFKFFQKVPNLEALKISDFSALVEMFPSQGQNDIDHIINILAQVRKLVLHSLPLLSSIGLHNSWVDTIAKNLIVLKISDCPRLTVLVPSSTATYCNLKKLKITRCHGLVYLLSTSVAKSLVQLHEMEISKCGSITKIVNHGTGDESCSDEIEFERLEFIILRHLPSLVSFYSGNVTLELSALLMAIIEKCPKMKCFSQGVVRAPNCFGINASWDEQDLYNYSDLNTTVQKIFDEKHAQFTRSVEKLKLGEHCDHGDIWHGVIPVPDGGFSKLKTLIVDGCQFLSHYVIPSHLVPLLSNLEDLQVRNCDSVKAIFEVGSLSCPFSSPVKTMALQQLSCLENVWSEDPQEFISFQSLQYINVRKCRSLKSLFPTSIFQGKLESLQILEVNGCEGLVEIVANDETVLRGATSNSIMFPNLSKLFLWRLPQLKCIYQGLDHLECPKLTIFNVYHCDQLRVFPTKDCGGIPNDLEAIVSFEKGFPNLEQLALDRAAIMNINWQGKYEADFIKRVKFLTLQCFHEDSDEFPYELFQKGSLPNLERLLVTCSNFKEIFSSQRPDVDVDNNMLFPHLKRLELFSLEYLESIGLEQSWVAPTVENLEILKVKHCHHIRNVVPSFVSFSKLRELHVEVCEGLVHLFSLSSAKSLGVLEDLSVSRCTSIQEIVSKEGHESDVSDVTFPKLKTLFLVHLQRLGCFHSGNSTLNFPCLELVIVEQCPRMRIFSNGAINSAKHLRISTDRTKRANFPLQQCVSDLNASIKLLFASQLKQSTHDVQDLKLDDYSEFGDIWDGVMPVPSEGFSKLKTLTVDGCKFLSHYVIPSHLVPFLSNLEDLQVRNCDSVKEIFEVGSLSFPFSIPLKTLTLQQLSGLENVWDEDPREFISFQSLQHVHVQGCRSLKSLFPASMSQCKLDSLEILHVERCEVLGEIVAANDERVLRGETSNSVVFPSLTTLHLWNLPHLKCIYPGLDHMECLKLKVFLVYHCDQLGVFPTNGRSQAPIHVEAIVSFEKGFPNLEQLALNKADIMNIKWQGKCEANFIQGVKSLILQCFHECSDRFPFELFQKGSLPNLEKLSVTCSSFKEIFSAERPVVDLDCDLFPNLKGLELKNLVNLKSIGFEQSWVAPMLENLETLGVQYCSRLRNVVPSAVSFSKLRELLVFGCQGLAYLFTLSTTRSLVSLERLSITSCASIQEIVSREGDESDEKDITFLKLKILSLVSLQWLGSFHSEDCTFKFPSLELVTIQQCPRMRIFSGGATISTEQLRVSTKLHKHVEYRGMGLNASIELIFSTLIADFARDASYLKFSEHPELQGIWEGLTLVPHRGFSKLRTLIVDCHQFSSHYVIPSHLLVFLICLEDLQVQMCDSAKAIFDVGPLSTPFTFPLKKMTLVKLPNLEKVWNDDPQKIHSFQSLQHVHVDECRSLRSLFPASMAKGKLESLEILEVKWCEELVEIVATNEISSSEEESRNLIMFPSLTELQLWELPKLKHICSSELNNVGWPKLETLQVSSCPCLLHLAPSTVSFSNLRHLDVDECDGLVYLFTSLTAKSFAFLENLTVSNCGSMREIVAKEDDESDQDEIMFGNLKTLNLDSLPIVDSFYSGKYNLKFPCLEQMEIYDCSQMKVFSHANIYARDNVTIDSDNDLIDMLEKAFNKKATET